MTGVGAGARPVRGAGWHIWFHGRKARGDAAGGGDVLGTGETKNEQSGGQLRARGPIQACRQFMAVMSGECDALGWLLTSEAVCAEIRGILQGIPYRNINCHAKVKCAALSEARRAGDGQSRPRRPQSAVTDDTAQIMVNAVYRSFPK